LLFYIGEKENRTMQNQQNPDVNSTTVEEDYPVEPNNERHPNNIEDLPGHDAEREPTPDGENSYPFVDPPLVDDAPLGDVDDSPKRIADD
jgi:hypothetical protein